MDATNKPSSGRRKLARGPLLILLPSLAFMILGYQNCAVDLASTTPGAASNSCEVDPAVLDDFESVLNGTLMATGTLPSSSKLKCGACHNHNSGNSANAAYMVFQGNTATNPELVEQNYCAAQDIGIYLVNHAMQASGHGGGQYTEAEIQALVDFARANF